jgi:hypothetical protein
VARYLKYQEGQEYYVLGSQEKHYPQLELVRGRLLIFLLIHETLDKLGSRQTEPVASKEEVLPVDMP